MDLGIAGLIGGGVSILGNLLGQSKSYSNNKKLMAQQQEYNRQNAEWQNQVNIQNWQMQNDYNTPAAQVQRLQEAGLNPALIYGNGSTSTGNAQSPQGAASVDSVPYPEANFGDFGAADAVRAYVQLQSMANQGELQQSQAQYADAQRILAEKELLLKDKQISNLDADYLNKMFTYNLSKDVRTQMIQSYFLKNEESNARIQSIYQGIQKSDQDIIESAQRVQEMQSRMRLNEVQAIKIEKETHKIAFDMVKTLEETKGVQLDNQFKSMSMADRVATIQAALQDCIQRTKNNKLDFDIKDFEQKSYRITGFKGEGTWSYVNGLIKRLLWPDTNSSEISF